MTDKQQETLNKDIKSSSAIDAVFDKGGIFEKSIKDYVPRQGQMQMAHAVGRCFNRGNVLIAEAGTGTGKTFAYLVPALKAYKNVVISTASKALQDQIILNDIPRLVKILKLDIRYMVLKGFSNYLCLRNFYESKQLGVFSPKQLASLESLIESEKVLIAQESDKCTFCEINSRYPKKITDLITCQSHNCLQGRCIYKDQCFAFAARQRASQSQIVVINHALFFSTLHLQNTNPMASLLPDYNALIFDEAHTLPDIGRNFFARSISGLELKEIQKDFFEAIKDVKDFPKGGFEDLFLLIDEASTHLYEYLESKLHPTDGKGEKINILYLKYTDYHEDGDNFTVDTTFRQKVGDLYLKLDKLVTLMENNKESAVEEIEGVVGRVVEARDVIVDCMTVDKDKMGNVNKQNQVSWIELGHKNYALSISPLDIGLDFGRFLLSKIERKVGVVMTSATISVKESFDKFIYDIGGNLLDDHIQTMIVPSVFDYAKNSILFVSKDFAPISDAFRIRRIIDKLEKAMDSVTGGIFFLTTSYRALNEASVILADRFRDKRQVLVQNSMSNSKLMDEFKKDGRAILIGTSSFWEGVDVPGRALSMVIIDKIPFGQPTDPLLQARCENLKKNGKNPFITLSIPEAVIALRQGVGRLIRKENDTGVMIICDPRLEQSSYGQIFLQSLPDMRRASSVDDIVAFFKEAQA
ncbi:Probable ATP-dependent helicase dinG homolog [Anaerobiospirillum thomasii]|uniref:ATP-dependent DNA helicase n=1 Tax=Anaerobiospirillum thomasii TaxID=179995 RepID=UPI000D950E13|nr:ATP-dependent DNA helicase [Anaerobiospirillum thomasii]SPT67890.1 Probable ATP-dependent helicase dinG homolog [Anaerobiospirillum thomasii]